MKNNWVDFSKEITFGEDYDKVEVVGKYCRGHNGIISTYNDPLGEPPEPSEVEIEEILFKEVNIMPFIHYKDLEDIENEVISELDYE